MEIPFKLQQINKNVFYCYYCLYYGYYLLGNGFVDTLYFLCMSLSSLKGSDTEMRPVKKTIWARNTEEGK